MKTKKLELSYNLFFAPLDLTSDIHALEDINSFELQSYILAESTTNKVYLVSVCGKEQVTDDIAFVLRFINLLSDRISTVPDDFSNEPIDLDVYFQEYNSFEDAFKVALSMKEENELCYSEQ